jgi:hypothetical protein
MPRKQRNEQIRGSDRLLPRAGQFVRPSHDERDGAGPNASVSFTAVFIVNTRTVSDALLIAFASKIRSLERPAAPPARMRPILAAGVFWPPFSQSLFGYCAPVASWASPEVAATVEMNATVTRAGHLVTRVNGMIFLPVCRRIVPISRDALN